MPVFILLLFLSSLVVLSFVFCVGSCLLPEIPCLPVPSAWQLDWFRVCVQQASDLCFMVPCPVFTTTICPAWSRPLQFFDVLSSGVGSSSHPQLSCRCFLLTLLFGLFLPHHTLYRLLLINITLLLSLHLGLPYLNPDKSM